MERLALHFSPTGGPAAAAPPVRREGMGTFSFGLAEAMP
jgi:hypothetical protein